MWEVIKFNKNIAMYLVVGVLLGIVSVRTRAQETDVPVNIQLPLITKILTYNRSLKNHSHSTFVFGILYQKNFRNSERMKDEMISCGIEDSIQFINHRGVEWLPVPVSDNGKIDTAIFRRLDVLYITPVRNVDIGSLTSYSQRNRILTVTGVSRYVDEGITIGIGSQGEKPVIYVNLSSAKAEGADFSSQFLKLVRLVGEKSQ